MNDFFSRLFAHTPKGWGMDTAGTLTKALRVPAHMRGSYVS
jgi:hypothetical protein